MKASLIIPTYKSENTIGYCLDSVINQTYGDFECIIVDYNIDGKTKNIIEKYLIKDKRIRYLESPNKGAMAQREFGIKNSNGEYICFVDSDDIIHPQYLEMLINNTNESDLVCCEMARVSSAKEAELIIAASSNTNTRKVTRNRYKKLLKNYRKNIGNPTPVCLMTTKNTFIYACKYYNSKQEIESWEDTILSYFLFFNSSNVTFIGGSPLYFYIKNKNSTTHNIVDNDKYLEDCIKVAKITNNIIKNSRNKRNARQAYIYLSFGIITFLLSNENLNKKLFKSTRKKVKKIINVHKLRVFENEFTISEKALTLAIKYDFPFLFLKIAKKIKKNIN